MDSAFDSASGQIVGRLFIKLSAAAIERERCDFGSEMQWGETMWIETKQKTFSKVAAAKNKVVP